VCAGVCAWCILGGVCVCPYASMCVYVCAYLGEGGGGGFLIFFFLGIFLAKRG